MAPYAVVNVFAPEDLPEDLQVFSKWAQAVSKLFKLKFEGCVQVEVYQPETRQLLVHFSFPKKWGWGLKQASIVKKIRDMDMTLQMSLALHSGTSADEADLRSSHLLGAGLTFVIQEGNGNNADQDSGDEEDGD